MHYVEKRPRKYWAIKWDGEDDNRVSEFLRSCKAEAAGARRQEGGDLYLYISNVVRVVYPYQFIVVDERGKISIYDANVFKDLFSERYC